MRFNHVLDVPASRVLRGHPPTRPLCLLDSLANRNAKGALLFCEPQRRVLDQIFRKRSGGSRNEESCASCSAMTSPPSAQMTALYLL
jgi:hypothetical protein